MTRIPRWSRVWRPFFGEVRLLCVLVVGVVACTLGTAPLPPEATQFTPPAVYARWWAMTQACSGLSANFAAVKWYGAPGSAFVHDGQWMSAYMNPRAARIVLAEDVMEDGAVVRHEMLHMLLQVRGHPRSQFLEACGPLVGCEGICATDAGIWQVPQSDYMTFPPESLDVLVRVELLPREDDGQRWLALEVTVRNTRTHAVLVSAPGDPAKPDIFGFDVRGPAGGISSSEIAGDSSTLFFMPFETKRRLFEFRVKSGRPGRFHVPPGDHLVRGGYARLWSEYTLVTVTP